MGALRKLISIIANAAGALLLTSGELWAAQHFYIDPIKNGDGLSMANPAANTSTLAATLDSTGKTIVCNDVIHLRAGSNIVHGPWDQDQKLAQRINCADDTQKVYIRPYSNVAPFETKTKAIIDGTDFYTSPLNGKRMPGSVIQFVKVPDTEIWKKEGIELPVNVEQCDDVEINGVMHLPAKPHYKLLGYSRWGDFVAINQSFASGGSGDEVKGIPLDDPRDGPERIGDPVRDSVNNNLILAYKQILRKMPWTYMGPGFFWERDSKMTNGCRGTLYVRLSHTILNAAGVMDYTFNKNPNQVPLTFSSSRPNKNLVLVGTRNVQFERLVFRNAADTTVRINENGRNIVFANCDFHAARMGVTVAHNNDSNKAVTFRQSVFDGGLAPWTMRSDVKSNYEYCTVPVNEHACPINCTGPGCEHCCPADKVAENNLAKKSADTLVYLNGANGTVIENCTFRRGHDGLQIVANDVTVRQSLFEDLNDEAVRFAGGSDTRFYRNLIRQALNPLSFSGRVRDKGSVYVYRNIIDQRVPVRGMRTLPPDADVPFLWRHGLDFKLENNSALQTDGTYKPPRLPDIYVYQNTFVSSHETENNFSTELLNGLDKHPCSRRIHVNNIHVGVNMQLPISQAQSSIVQATADCGARPSKSRRSVGNLWYQYHDTGKGPAKYLWTWPGGTGRKDFASLAAMHADPEFADWEKGSFVEAPRLRNFDDEIFHNAMPPPGGFPHNDWRPIAGISKFEQPKRGVSLAVEELTDAPGFPVTDQPVIGALDVGSPAFIVGANNEVVFPRSGYPIARARVQNGSGLFLDDGARPVNINDPQNDGFELVKLSATQSVDPGGGITAFEWSERGQVLSNSATPTLLLAEGDHDLRLTVRDAGNNSDTDAIRVRVSGATLYGENLLSCPGFEDKVCAWNLGGEAAVNTNFAHSGARSLHIKGSFANATTRIEVNPGTTYRFSGWLRGLTVGPVVKSRVVFRAFNASGAPVTVSVDGTGCAVTSCVWSAGASFSHYQMGLTVPESANALEIQLSASSPDGGGVVWDDIRFQDRNLLRNAGFERRASSGAEDEVRDWNKRNGVRVLTGSGVARGGMRALRLLSPTRAGAGSVTLEQQIMNLPAAVASYRLSGWVKYSGGDPPSVRLFAEHSLDDVPADGNFHYFTREITKNANVREAVLSLRTYEATDADFDDLLLVQK